MTPGARDHFRTSVVRKSRTNRHRRFKLRRLKSLQKEATKIHRDPELEADGVGTEAPTEISLSLSSSASSDTFTEKEDAAVLGGENGGSVAEKLRIHSHSSVSVIGRRREMEDAVRVEIGFLEGFDFFGVYDGHGGPQVARACEEGLHVVVAAGVAAGGGDGGEGMVSDWEKVMTEGFVKMDGEVCDVGKTVGSTAVVAVVGKDEVVVANCGDSRAVMSRGGIVVPLSDDHKPNRPDELKRIESEGGRVFNWNGHRVLGVLATSRSIGDQYLKPYVTSVPEITVTKRTDSDEFLILASDGLWDVMSNEFACHVVRRFLSGQARRKARDNNNNSSVVARNSNNSAAMDAAEVLVQLAIARGSEDNISVIVVELNKVI